MYHKKLVLFLIIAILITCISLSSCFITNTKNDNPYKIKINTPTSEIEGLIAESVILQHAQGNANPYLEIYWKNTTDKSIKHKSKFDFYKKAQGKWISIKKHEDIYMQHNFIIEANNGLTLRYDLWDVNIDETGTYKFETSFWQQFGMEFPNYKYSMEFEVCKIPQINSNLVEVIPTFQVGYTYGEPVLKGYATTINQVVAEDGKHLKDGSVLNVTWYNGTGRDLYTYAEYFRFFKSGAESFSSLPPADTMNKITLQTDDIQTISFKLNGAEILDKGKYTLIACFYTDTGYSYSPAIYFEIQ